MNADQFRHAMSQLPEPVTTLEPPNWEYWRWQLWQHVTSGRDPRDFLSWACIYHTMLQNHWPNSIALELEALRPEADYWHRAITMPHFGNPPDYLPGTDFSMNQIHQCYHLKQWQDFTSWKVAGLNRIVEFGGGYGAMALACHRLGFRGEYIIYDLPEFALLQQYYLSQMGMPATWWEKPKVIECDLLIGIYSLSECPFGLRQHFLNTVGADSHLFLYSGQWEDYDNVSYFQNPQRMGFLEEWGKWQHTELTHLPFPNNWYSVGYWQ